MELTFSDNKLFTTIFDNIKQYSDTFKLQINEEGLHIQSIDTANICILDFKIEKNYFNSFKTDKAYILDFDINDITKIFKVINKSNLTLFTLQEETILKIISESSENNIKKIFKINSISTNSEFLNLNTLVINNDFRTESKQLLNIFTDLFMFSEDITLLINTFGFQFIVNNDNIKSKYCIDSIKHNSEINTSFSLKYLSKFKLLSLFETTNIKLDNNTPISFNLNDDNININFILSPKIDI